MISLWAGCLCVGIASRSWVLVQCGSMQWFFNRQMVPPAIIRSRDVRNGMGEVCISGEACFSQAAGGGSASGQLVLLNRS